MKLELYTERLYLRPYDLADVNLDIEMATDPEVMRYFGGAVTEGTRRAYGGQRPAFRVTRDHFKARFGGTTS